MEETTMDEAPNSTTDMTDRYAVEMAEQYNKGYTLGYEEGLNTTTLDHRVPSDLSPEHEVHFNQGREAGKADGLKLKATPIPATSVEAELEPTPSDVTVDDKGVQRGSGL